MGLGGYAMTTISKFVASINQNLRESAFLDDDYDWQHIDPRVYVVFDLRICLLLIYIIENN